MNDQVLYKLQQFPQFSEVPEKQLKRYIELSKICLFEPDEVIISLGEIVDSMFLLLDGDIRLDMKQGDQYVNIANFQQGDITGKLPFSRLQSANGYVKVVEESTVLVTHEEQFKELVKNYDLIETFVHALSDRVRDFTTQQQQNEKLLALGKLSAGVAHELNNPSSAIVRGAAALKEHLENRPGMLKDIIKTGLDPEQISFLSDLIVEKIGVGIMPCSLIEKTEKEDDIIDWLSDHPINDPESLAESFTDYNITTEDLELVLSRFSGDILHIALNWIDEALVTERMINEMEEASRRISDLVASIKTYSHMDQSNEKQFISPAELIQSTLRILDHKVKEKNISVDLALPDNLPPFQGWVSELNQVWMNILDNAIDAVEKHGTIRITGRSRKDAVEIRFQDDGSGIPDEMQSKVFDPFFTTKKIGQGTGLGLDLVKKIIEKHEGAVRLESKPGKTIFILSFPL